MTKKDPEMLFLITIKRHHKATCCINTTIDSTSTNRLSCYMLSHSMQTIKFGSLTEDNYKVVKSK